MSIRSFLKRHFLVAPEPWNEFRRDREQEYRDSTQRWRALNEQARKGPCMCGAPVTEVRYDHRNHGAVPVEFWSCAEHVGVNSWTKLPNSPYYIPTSNERKEFWRD